MSATPKKPSAKRRLFGNDKEVEEKPREIITIDGNDGDTKTTPATILETPQKKRRVGGIDRFLVSPKGKPVVTPEKEEVVETPVKPPTKRKEDVYVPTYIHKHGWEPPLAYEVSLSEHSWIQHAPGFWWQSRPSNFFEWFSFANTFT